MLLGYFGETAGACGNCDVCLDGAEVIDGTIAAQKAMSAMLRTGERFGTEHLINLLVGEETEAIGKFRHHALPTFGVGKEFSKNEWRSIFRQLHAAGIIEQDIASYGRWIMTPAGRAVLKGEARLSLRKDTLKPAGRKERTARATRAALGESSGADAALFEALKQHRTTLAKTQGVPAYVVFADRTLLEMARLRPKTLTEMREVHGVGEAKLKQYGETFLTLIREKLG
jgi:ATP-dependent DNA helicase RecQ